MRFDFRDSWNNTLDRGAFERHQPDARDPEREPAARQLLVPTQHLDLPGGREKERVRTQDRKYLLNGRQVQTLAIIGTFRAIEYHDLRHYGEETHTFDLDRLALKRQEALDSHFLFTMSGHRLHILTLTESARTLLQHASAPGSPQQYHAGKPEWNNIRHDSAVYRMYQQEAGRLEASGARILRVIIEAEIKQSYQRLIGLRAVEAADPGRARQDARAEFANAWQLPVVRDRLQMPDLRLEYETEAGDRQHVDLELMTERYTPDHVAAKTSTGFVVYRPASPTAYGMLEPRLNPERLLP